jgi:hypothetical protein
LLRDPSQVAWLAADGIAFDILGALILSRSFIWARPRDLGEQAVGTSWAGNDRLLRALAEQQTDACWGAALLVLGFVLQAASSVGVQISWAESLLLALLALILS